MYKTALQVFQHKTWKCLLNLFPGSLCFYATINSIFWKTFIFTLLLLYQKYIRLLYIDFSIESHEHLFLIVYSVGIFMCLLQLMVTLFLFKTFSCLLFIFCLIEPTQTSSSVLNRNSDKRHLCLFQTLKRRVLSLFNIMLSYE